MTRMWGVPAADLCDNHLRGEWNEIWKVLGSIRTGNLNPVIAQCAYMNLQLDLIPDRLKELYAEMVNRGWSPNPDLLEKAPEKLPEVGTINVALNKRALELRDCECYSE